MTKINLNKKVVVFLSSVLLTVCSAFSKEGFVSFSAGFPSGVPFYGSERINTNFEDMGDEQSRAIIGVLGELSFNVNKAASFFVGTDFLCDLNSSSEARCNILSLDFDSGLKIYPGIGGLNFGLSYVLGYRADYSGNKEETLTRTMSSWGNGFKLLVEYNFAHEGSLNILPAVGIFWKRMPRGEKTFDNQLCAYVTVHF